MIVTVKHGIVAAGIGFFHGDKIRLYRFIVAPEYFFSVFPSDRYRLFIAKYRNGVIARLSGKLATANLPRFEKLPESSFSVIR